MYRAELFNMYTRSFVSFFMLDKNVTITDDYLSPRKFDIDAPAGLECEVKNTITIKDGTVTIYTGYIDNIAREKERTVLTVAPLMMLLNEQSIQNVRSTDWANQIDWQIWYDFRQPTPSLYSIPFYRYGNTPYSNWEGRQVPYGAVLKNDMECILLARKTFGKFLQFGLSPTDGWLGVPHYGYRKFTGTAKFDADFDNVIDKEIVESSQNGKNILIIWMPSENDPTNYVHYDCVLLDDGTIETNGTHKSDVSEPRLVTKVLNEYTQMSSSELYAQAVQNLKPSADNLNIKLTYKKGDKIGRPEDRIIGYPSEIYSNGKTYKTFLTGKIYNRDTITLVFGMTRQGLTEQLNEEE